jgi:hypothetical protein
LRFSALLIAASIRVGFGLVGEGVGVSQSLAAREDRFDSGQFLRLPTLGRVN